jgi:hypothetical protein
MIVGTATTLYPVESVQAEIENLAHLATAVLNEHTSEAGLCAVCGTGFPCDSAILADHNLALL